MKPERLQKLLSRAGIASRRKAEELIRAGRVRVGGRVVTELGTRVDPRERIEVDGQRIVEEERAYVVLHKPRGVMTTLSDPEGRRTVAELVESTGLRLVPVGRLDYHTSGVLLLTNDGDFAAALSHPKSSVPKVYVAKVQGVLDERGLASWTKSIVIDGRPTQPASVRILRVESGKTWIEVTLSEGRNRQVRRLGEATGFAVMRLARTSFAGIDAEGLRPGQWRHLTLDELIRLKRDYGVPRKVRAPDDARVRGKPPARTSERREKPLKRPRRGPSSGRAHG